MKTNWRIAALGAIFMLANGGQCDLWAQDGASQPSVLHIQQSQTTLPPTGFVPTFLAMYHVLDGAKSPANMLALTSSTLGDPGYATFNFCTGVPASAGTTWASTFRKPIPTPST